MPYLEVRTPKGNKRLKLNSEPITVGRQPDNVLVLRDDRASRHHCIIEPIGGSGGFRVRDLGSRNGTKLNDKNVAEEILDNGDVIRIGKSELHYIDPEQLTPRRRRRDAPDFSAARENGGPDLYDQHTVDFDFADDLDDVQTTYERKLREIIDTAPEKPFDENDISLVDARGVTIHQAMSAGMERTSEGDGGEGLRAFRLLLLAAFRARATDLHIEPRLDNATIRLRVDGYMLQAVELSMAICKRIFGVVKILCQIDTSQKAQVQDGHFSVAVKGRRVDYRVSFTPAVHGQKLVIRVLDSSGAPGRLHELGLVPWMYEKLRQVATKDAGMLLVCGPTGSGKTTTLYSCLREIDVEQRNAITIEDPVEYHLEGCTQIPIDHKQGHTFATILRSVLRQDPDVIFVGEVRDLETAQVAMQAAMTGHLVYTTVHSKDSIGAIFRLLDLGIENYLVANALNLIVAQRLIRVLCETCKKPIKPTPAQSMKMGTSVTGLPRIFIPTGCRKCLRTGYVGRRAIFELLDFTDQMRDIVLHAPSIRKLREIADQGLFMTLQQAGFQLVAQGVTSMDEIDRVAGSE